MSIIKKEKEKENFTRNPTSTTPVPENQMVRPLKDLNSVERYQRVWQRIEMYRKCLPKGC